MVPEYLIAPLLAAVVWVTHLAVSLRRGRPATATRVALFVGLPLAAVAAFVIALAVNVPAPGQFEPVEGTSPWRDTFFWLLVTGELVLALVVTLLLKPVVVLLSRRRAP